MTSRAASSLRAGGELRLQIVLGLSAFVASLSYFATTPFYPQMARDLHTTAPLLGQIVTLMALLSAALGLIVGPLADRYGYRWPLVFGLLALASGLLGSALAPVFPMVLGLSLLSGLGDALTISLPFAITATAFSGDAQRRTIAWTVAAISMAPIIGVPLLTTIGGAASWRAAVAVAGIMAVAVAWLVAVALPPDGERATNPVRVRGLLAAYAPLLRHRPSVRLLAVTTIRGVWWFGSLTYLGAFLGTAVGLGERQVGLVYSLAGGAYVVGSVIAGGRRGTISPRTIVAAATVAAGVLFGVALIDASLWVVLPALLVAKVASAQCGIGVMALLAVESPAQAGTTMILNNSVLSLGTAVGAVLGGSLIAVASYSALGVGVALLALIGAILAWWPASA